MLLWWFWNSPPRFNCPAARASLAKDDRRCQLAHQTIGARRVTAARRALAPARSWKYDADAQSSDRTTFCLTYVLRNAAAPGWSPRRDCWVAAHASQVWQSLWFRLRAELWLAVRRPAGSPVPLCSEWPVKKTVDGRPAPGTVYQFICSDTVRPTPTPSIAPTTRHVVHTFTSLCSLFNYRVMMLCRLPAYTVSHNVWWGSIFKPRMTFYQNTLVKMKK